MRCFPLRPSFPAPVCLQFLSIRCPVPPPDGDEVEGGRPGAAPLPFPRGGEGRTRSRAGTPRSRFMDDDRSFLELIRRVRAGDEAAALDLVRRYEPAVRRVVRLQLRDPRLRRILDSMDVCQSVMASFFLRAATGQYDLDRPAQLLALLAVMARNKLASKARVAYVARRELSPAGADEAWSAAPAGAGTWLPSRVERLAVRGASSAVRRGTAAGGSPRRTARVDRDRGGGRRQPRGPAQQLAGRSTAFPINSDWTSGAMDERRVGAATVRESRAEGDSSRRKWTRCWTTRAAAGAGASGPAWNRASTGGRGCATAPTPPST